MIDPKRPLILSLEERRTNLWAKLMEQWESQLDAMRQQNDSDLTELQTAHLRGRIAAIKTCIALNKDVPSFE
jgi:hypothetical protein